MPVMPDLVEDDLTVFAWWNALEAGATSIDPVDALDYQPIYSWEPFDNGIQGELTDSIDGHPIRFRVKTDGWVVCWIEADTEIDVERTLLNYDEQGGPDLLPNNRLADHIENIRTELGSPGNYNPEDTGLFFYDHEAATEIGIWDKEVSIDSSDEPDTIEETPAISLTDQVDMHHLVAVGHTWADIGSYSSDGGGGTIQFDGETILDSMDTVDNEVIEHWDRLDILATLTLESYQFYTFSVAAHKDGGSSDASASGALFAFYEITGESA